jgi:enoyl-CoA hydratase
VAIRSTNERAFCAGGDVRAVGILSDPRERQALGRPFVGSEYRVTHRIHTFPKPFVALVAGIDMGGGLGLSVHGSHCVVSETLRMAMPETILGLAPDVGATWFFNRCPGMIGRYLAMTGAQIGAADALYAGLATHHVSTRSLGSLCADLAASVRLDAMTIDEIIARHESPAVGGLLSQREAMIDRLFEGDDLDAVMAAIDGGALDVAWVAEMREMLARASPTSLRVTWRRMIEGAGQSIDRILSDDYRLSVSMFARSDFVEGVRAVLVNKSHRPRWTPASLSEVDDAAIDMIFREPCEELCLVD